MFNKKSLYYLFFRVKSKAKAAKQQAKPLGNWLHHQREALRINIPERPEFELWLQSNASKFGWTRKPRSDSLEHLEQVLTAINAAIQQQSNRRVRILVTSLLGKTTGVITSAGKARFTHLWPAKHNFARVLDGQNIAASDTICSSVSCRFAQSGHCNRGIS